MSANLKTNIYFKLGVTIFLVLLLLIPSSMILLIIDEREDIRQEAIDEVSAKWGNAQTIIGPFVSIPFSRKVINTNAKDSLDYYIVKNNLHILPEQLMITSEIIPEIRYRGIHEVVTYKAIIKINGFFNKIELDDLDIQYEELVWDRASMTIGIDDLRGIGEQINVDLNGIEYSFDSGVINNDVVDVGVNAIIDMNIRDFERYDFNIEIDLKGSNYLQFTPVGKETRVLTNSIWANPSFTGAYLPDSRSVDEQGFKAMWKVFHLNRNYPQSWIGTQADIEKSAFGINLLMPVDNYQKSSRAIKYAILIIGLIFLSFFFIEFVSKIFMHPVQYLLVGLALVIFYILLLSLSEYMSFNLSFIISSSATILLIASYVRSVLKSMKYALLIAFISALLYTFIFIIIQLQDFALVVGSIAIFMILALVMYFSRNIDWYNISMISGKKESQNDL